MKPRNNALSTDDADTLALQGLTFIASESQRLARFLSLTGLSPSDLKNWGTQPTMALAVLEYLMSDESLLLVFAAEQGIPPQSVATALERLAGTHGRDWHST